MFERRSFALTNDPRKRDLSNVALLTGGLDYDVVYVADADGEFARYCPLRHLFPAPRGRRRRPARAGLALESRAFRRAATQPALRPPGGGPDVPEDWAAWAAIRTVIEAVTKTRHTDVPALRAYISSDAFAFDLYKGLPGSYRPWDGQLRQQIILADSDATLAIAPLPQFLHQTNVLDTLGTDQPESACTAR